jgi:hypothetical protein
MSSINVPTTDKPALATPRAEQPASEWASTTLSALDPTTEAHPPSMEKTVPTTPGVDMPGGFPGPPQGALSQPDVQYAKEVAFNALETAKGYATTAAQSATTAAQSAGDTVAPYLPAAVASYLPGNATQAGANGHGHKENKALPSQETSQNYHPSSPGGVGTLPGPPGEIGVAMLPDERTGGKSVDEAVKDSVAASEVTKTSPITTTTNNNPIPSTTTAPTTDPLSKHTGYIPGTLQNDTSLAKLPEERRQHGLPSHDDNSNTQLGKSGGVGALPGSANESGVALLPDQRKVDKGMSTAPSADGADTDASIRSLAGSRQDPAGAAPVGQVHLNQGPRSQPREHSLAKDEGKAFGGNILTKDQVDTGVPGPAGTTIGATSAKNTNTSTIATPGHDGYPSTTTGPVPPAKKSSHDTDKLTPKVPAKESSQDADKPRAVGAGSGGLAGAGGPASSSPPKKSGFMDKVKGEMKVISGKMSKDDAKIEEGRRMMGKN